MVYSAERLSNDATPIYNYIEITNISEEYLENLSKMFGTYLFNKDSVSERINYHLKKQKLIRKLYKVAFMCLTTQQLEIFIMWHIFGMKDKEIGELLGRTRNYIYTTNKECLEKIKLEIEKIKLFNIVKVVGKRRKEERYKTKKYLQTKYNISEKEFELRKKEVGNIKLVWKPITPKWYNQFTRFKKNRKVTLINKKVKIEPKKIEKFKQLEFDFGF